MLATIRKNEITVKTKIGLSDLPHLVNSMLLEPTNGRCWTHAFKLLAGVVGPDLLSVDSVAQKCSRNDTDNRETVPPDLSAGQVFNVFSRKAHSAVFNVNRMMEVDHSPPK
ncbi:hypothetical protein QLQ09_08810 [Brucella sp. NM4]|uniref:hypothetical protein n=1 Tax=Brucella/Ochrobactrum group TaxID=2826938 RepID=UPI0024BBF178|nr:hypothetical protein [Brucella sp. NM4]WHS32056.1 hypothetical protein QLQ09_08810 [Brucella sp. NM4]WHT41463.1 hypothetical protein QLQ11_08575 [Ochrobactrum sp. SSR]